MRFFKKTVFWLIIMAAIGGSFYLVDRRVEEQKVVEEIKKRLFSFETEDVIEFQIAGKNENILLRKDDAEWRLKNPLEAAADKEAVQNLLNAVVGVKFDATLFESQSPEKLKEMGIEGPDRLTVTFKTSSGTEKTVVFGDRNPTMNLGFAILKDDPRVFRLTADVRAEADKTVYDLRDKTVLNFEPLKIKNIQIKWSGNAALAIDHPEGGKWHIVKPEKAVADALKMTELVYRIRDAKIKAFVDESPKDLTQYGLSKPRLQFDITDEKGNKLKLLIGERDRVNRGLFAKRGDTPNIFSLEEGFIVDIPQTAGELKGVNSAVADENKKTEDKGKE